MARIGRSLLDRPARDAVHLADWLVGEEDSPFEGEAAVRLKAVAVSTGNGKATEVPADPDEPDTLDGLEQWRLVNPIQTAACQVGDILTLISAARNMLSRLQSAPEMEGMAVDTTLSAVEDDLDKLQQSLTELFERGKQYNYAEQREAIATMLGGEQVA